MAWEWWDEYVNSIPQSRAWKIATTPLLPELSPIEGEEEGVGRRLYRNLIRPLSSPASLPALLPYGKAAQGMGKIGLAFLRKAPRGQRAIAGAGDIDTALYGSLLSSPQTQARAGLGGFSGAMFGGLEETLKGNYTALPRVLRGYLPDKSIPRFGQGFMGRTPNTGRVPTPSNQGIVNKILGIPTRSLSGLDAVNVGAMSDAGINLDRARRLTLAGKPETKTGRRVVGLIEGLKPFSHIPIPFARVGVHTLEQAGISSDPAAKWRRLVSLGLGGAAYKWGDMVPPEYTPYMTALAGPYALPVAAGIATKHATEAAKDPEAALVSELGRQIPYPIGQNPLRAFLPEQLAREFYPNILRDVARFGDPYERSIKSPPGMFPTPSTAIGEFETLRAKVPGESGRESLPGASRRRDIFGEELAGRKNNPFKRFITSEPMTYDPYPDTPEVNTVREANIKMRPPAYTRQVTIGGLSIPLTPEESEGFQMLSREDLRKKLVDYTNSDRFKNLDDSKKTFALKTFLRMMNQMGSMKAKAGTLKNVDKSQVEQAVDKYKKERGVK